ncbi:MAG: transcription termination/antitermination protein NusG [Holosporales bacterium]|jgi:transcriptional antiterminator NusG|nr:transcription termination/antitermination protein NusG [Holosporales bacterium]
MESTKWYVVSVYSGLENGVVDAIKTLAARKGLIDQIEDIIVPTEETVEVRRGTKVTVNRSYFPGYVLLKANLTDELWSLICSVPRVNGFLGAKKPLPVSESEISRIFAQVKESHERPRNKLSFEVGEVVKVTDGPFTSFSGAIEAVDSLKERLTVSVMIFGRPTPIELEYSQVEKG